VNTRYRAILVGTIVLAAVTPLILKRVWPRDPFIDCIDVLKTDADKDGVDITLTSALLEASKDSGKAGLSLKTSGEQEREFQALSQPTIRSRYQVCLSKYGVPSPRVDATINVSDTSGPVPDVDVSETRSKQHCAGRTDTQGQCSITLQSPSVDSLYEFIVTPGYRVTGEKTTFAIGDFANGIKLSVEPTSKKCRFNLPVRKDGRKEAGRLTVTVASGQVVTELCRATGARGRAPDGTPCNVVSLAPGEIASLHVSPPPDALDTDLQWGNRVWSRTWLNKPCDGLIVLDWPIVPEIKCDSRCKKAAADSLQSLAGNLIGKPLISARFSFDAAGRFTSSPPAVATALRQRLQGNSLHSDLVCCQADLKWPSP
jgi:hypothetical protein